MRLPPFFVLNFSASFSYAGDLFLFPRGEEASPSVDGLFIAASKCSKAHFPPALLSFNRFFILLYEANSHANRLFLLCVLLYGFFRPPNTLLARSSLNKHLN